MMTEHNSFAFLPEKVFLFISSTRQTTSLLDLVQTTILINWLKTFYAAARHFTSFTYLRSWLVFLCSLPALLLLFQLPSSSSPLLTVAASVRGVQKGSTARDYDGGAVQVASDPISKRLLSVTTGLHSTGIKQPQQPNQSAYLNVVRKQLHLHQQDHPLQGLLGRVPLIFLLASFLLLIFWLISKRFAKEISLKKEKGRNFKSRNSDSASQGSLPSAHFFITSTFSSIIVFLFDKVASSASYFMSLVSDTVAGTLEMASASDKEVYDSASSTIGGLSELVVAGAGIGSSQLLPGEELIDLNAEDLDEEGESDLNRSDSDSDTSGDPELLRRKQRQQAYDRQLKISKMGGLYNEGNTCFMNSVIQSLASLDSVDIFLDGIYNSEKLPNKAKSPSVLLRKLIHEVNTKSLSRHTYSTNDLVRSMGNQSRWMSYDQEDAQEFFQQVLSFIEKDVKSTRNEPEAKEKSKAARILSPFDGETAIRVGCLKCGEMEGIRQEVMSSVGLSLTATTNHVDLLDLLDEYSQLETIPGVECYRCSLVALEKNFIKRLAPPSPKSETNDEDQEAEAVQPLPAILRKSFEARLAEIQRALTVPVIDEKQYKALKPQNVKELGDKSKQVMFARPTARVLAIHINRSVFDPSTGYIRKNMSPVSFGEELDLSPFVVQDVNDPRNKDPRNPMMAAGVYEKFVDEYSEIDSDEEDENQDQNLDSTKDEKDTLAPELEKTQLIDEPISNNLTPVSTQAIEANSTTTSPDLLYKLKAVVVHYGSHNFGHYICYRRCRHGLWWRMSDKTVAQVDEDQVLNAQGVFMLFYERADERQKRLNELKQRKENEELEQQHQEKEEQKLDQQQDQIVIIDSPTLQSDDTAMSTATTTTNTTTVFEGPQPNQEPPQQNEANNDDVGSVDPQPTSGVHARRTKTKSGNANQGHKKKSKGRRR